MKFSQVSATSQETTHSHVHDNQSGTALVNIDQSDCTITDRMSKPPAIVMPLLCPNVAIKYEWMKRGLLFHIRKTSSRAELCWLDLIPNDLARGECKGMTYVGDLMLIPMQPIRRMWCTYFQPENTIFHIQLANALLRFACNSPDFTRFSPKLDYVR
jgi:hypothetical protein